jgi:hypothetical protein
MAVYRRRFFAGYKPDWRHKIETASIKCKTINKIIY